jgi:hypothetical protein
MAIEINGNIVQSNTQSKDAMLDISTKRSFQFIIPPPFVVVGGGSVFVIDKGSSDNGDNRLLLLFVLLGLPTDVDL